MKRPLLIVSALAVFTVSFSQENIVAKIKKGVTKQDAEAHLSFLASDEMRGRGTGSPEIAIAANYLATQFKISGLKPAAGSSAYFQEVGLWQTLPPARVDLRVATDVFKFMDDLLLINGKTSTVDGEIVFAGYGTVEDFNKVDIKGKLVLTYAGLSEASSPRQAYRKDAPDKYKRVMEKGGLALIEVVDFKEATWPMLAGFLGGSRVLLTNEQVEPGAMLHIWMKKSDLVNKLIGQKGASGNLAVEAASAKPISGKNIVGVLEGTDPKLKQEYIVLSAHYDHLGVNKNETTDSIYNGARDNGIGTTALIEAVRFLSQNPTKRSIVFAAFCGEEKGLLGSKWYAENPLIPLSQTVYNLDCDGAGYNNKTMATLVDLNRTTADESLKKACLAFGLGLGGDPAPEQNLYERSDNFNFAVKGVPAVDFSTGVTAFDDEIQKYYHQPADEVSTLDFDYLEKFFRAYVYSAYLIGNSPARPVWKAGDKFEEAGKKLYSK